MEETAKPGVWHLHSFDWTGSLSPEESEGLRSVSSVATFGVGQMVFSPQSSPDELYLLEDGLVRIYRRAPDGAETAFGYVAPGEIFGELAFFEGYDRDSYAESVRPSRIWKIPRNAFAKLLDSRPQLALGMTQQIASRFKRMERRVENLVFRDARSRVAEILLELAEDFGQPAGDGGVRIDIEFTQSELAALAGVTRQTANVHLRELEGEGLLERSGKLFTLRDRDGLQNLVTAGRSGVA